MNKIFGFFFTLLGWKVEGVVPEHIKKGVFVVAPHNSWKDFFVGLGVRAKLKLKIGFIGKAELFKPPFGFIFRWLGGTPALRTVSNNMVENYVTAINKSEDMLFAVAPEGTRKNVNKLRTGFYFMAHGANIPILRVGFDFERKVVIIAESFKTTGDFNEDMKKYFVPFFEEIGGFQKSWISNYKNDVF
jgi:1-acyl-sn-glycerol-3-phosphate acyltransferase